MKTKKYSVGRVDGNPIPHMWNGLGRFVIRRRFKSEAEAVEFIERLRKFDPVGVESGHYYLDGPERRQ